MAKNGQTANGVAHFAPMMELKAPQWNMRNPFNDLIGIALKEREMELKEKEMGLKEKGLGLDEQKFAYGAANDEINRQHALKLKKMDQELELDKILREKKYLQNTENAKRNRYSEIGNLLNSVRGDGSAREYITKNKDFLESLNGKYNLLEIYDVANMLDGFYNNSNSNSGVNGGNGIVGNGNANVYSPYGSTNLKDI